MPALHQWILLQRDDTPEWHDPSQPRACVQMGPCDERNRLEGARRERRLEAVDQTRLKVQGRQVIAWAAIDTDTRELLAVYAFCCRSSINTLVFQKRTMETCTNRRVVPLDGGPWYPGALDMYGLKWRHITFGERNATEESSGLEERARLFYDGLPSNTLDSLKSFMDLYKTWYTHLRMASGTRRILLEVTLS